MPKVKVAGFSVSLDGFAAAPRQSLENPLGEGGMALHEWIFGTRFFNEMIGEGGGRDGVDQDFAQAGMAGFGAHILGRNMFTPYRGGWADSDWTGWWGDNPPFHAPTFVLTHHPREPLVMAGGTTFHFVTDGPMAALEQAKAAAGDLDVKVGGGAATVRQYLAAGAIDEMHLAIRPILLGQGEPLFAGLDLPALGYRAVSSLASPLATHVTFTREA